MTDVITAGAPVARMPVPDHVRVLSVENAHDIVPHLDGQPNPDRANRVTVSFESQRGGIGQNHDMQAVYRTAGLDLDQMHDPSLESFRASLRGRFIFKDRTADVTVQPYVYDVRRGP